MQHWIVLDHRSLSSIGQKILIKLSHDETRFKKNKMRFMSEIKITEKKHFQILHDKSNIDGGDVDDWDLRSAHLVKSCETMDNENNGLNLRPRKTPTSLSSDYRQPQIHHRCALLQKIYSVFHYVGIEIEISFGIFKISSFAYKLTMTLLQMYIYLGIFNQLLTDQWLYSICE